MYKFLGKLLDWLTGFPLGFIAGLIFVGWVFAADERRAWRAETIERGLALYCPDTGDWSWKGECSVTETEGKE